jgi:hypothetical protein
LQSSWDRSGFSGIDALYDPATCKSGFYVGGDLLAAPPLPAALFPKNGGSFIQVTSQALNYWEILFAISPTFNNVQNAIHAQFGQ